jgi:hypothetical protein
VMQSSGRSASALASALLQFDRGHRLVGLALVCQDHNDPEQALDVSSTTGCQPKLFL